jgi:anti-sigma factor RsiW
MTCAEAAHLIGPWLDDELDVRSVVDVETHVARCAACSREKNELLGLRETARERLPRFDPPPALEERVLRAVRKAGAPRPLRRFWREAGLMAAAAAAAVIVTSSLQPRADAPNEVVEAHLRSLQAGHLADVASSDQHTVKPWFQGKVDFSVPARDFAADGFELVGGRLDRLSGRPVAALVYRHRQHLLNVFVWPGGASEEPVQSTSSRGYQVSSWAKDGLEFKLVTDVSAADADKLVGLLRG